MAVFGDAVFNPIGVEKGEIAAVFDAWLVICSRFWSHRYVAISRRRTRNTFANPNNVNICARFFWIPR